MEIEQQIMEWLYQIRSPFLTYIMVGLTLFGKEFALLIFFLLAGRLYIKAGVRTLMLYAGTVVTGLFLNVVLLKALIARERPNFIEHLVLENDYSFPSGHTMGILIVTLIYAIISYRIKPDRNRLLINLLLMYTATFFVGLSRVYLGVHYISDILGSVVIGSLYAIIVAITLKYRMVSKS